MSDGMSDARAMGEIARKVERAAWELRDAIYEAITGYRGMAIDPAAEVNEVLGRRCPYELARKPDRWGEVLYPEHTARQAAIKAVHDGGLTLADVKRAVAKLDAQEKEAFVREVCPHIFAHDAPDLRDKKAPGDPDPPGHPGND